MVFHLHGWLFGKIDALKWSIRAKQIANGRSGIGFSTFKHRTTWQWQLWVLLNIKNDSKATFCSQMKDELCGLCAAVWMCLGFFLLNPTFGTSPVAAGMVEGEGGGGGCGWHSMLICTNHNTVMQSNILIPASDKKREVQWHLINS